MRVKFPRYEEEARELKGKKLIEASSSIIPFPWNESTSLCEEDITCRVGKKERLKDSKLIATLKFWFIFEIH